MEMRHITNFSSARGLELPKQGEFNVMPTEFLTHIHQRSVQSHKPFLISAAAADRIVKGIAVASLFCALFLIGLNA
jgi:hypothetical protein